MLTPSSTSLEIKEFIKDKSHADLKCMDDIVKRLLKGEYQFRGKKGRVIIGGKKAFKINEEVGTITYKKSINMSSFYLQNVISLMIYNVLPKNKRHNIVKPLDFFICESRDNPKGISVFEYCNEGDLKNFIDSSIESKRFKELDQELVKCLKELYEVLMELYHKYGFIHNDLKIANVLVNRRPRGNIIDYKLADLDNSRIRLNNGFADLRRDATFSGIIPLPPITERIKDDQRYFIIEPYIGSGSSQLNGIFFRQNYDKNINIDIYTLILSILFYEPIIDNYGQFKELHKYLATMFLPEDLDKILDTMELSEFLPKRMDDIVIYLIYNKIAMKYI
jgi:serine/threonine protein kinase